MAYNILLNGKHTALGIQLGRLFLDDGARIAGLVEGGAGENVPGEEADENLFPIQWNRTSPISVHNVVVEAVNRLDTIDEMIFLFQPAIENKPIHELSLARVESYIDTYVKGSIFLLREILNYFQKKQAGTLHVVFHTAGLEVLPPIDAAGSGALEHFTNSLFTLYQNEPVHMNGFTSNSPDSTDYAQFIHDTIVQKARSSHGRWYRFSDRSIWNSLGFSAKNR